MKGALQIGLRAGERIYINGAVLRVDRKVRLELLNDATFLIGSHVIQLEDATTPMRQLYFLIQSLLMDPSVVGSLRPAIDAMIAGAMRSAVEPERERMLLNVGKLVAEDSYFEALKCVRHLMNGEDGAGRVIGDRQLSREVA